MTPRVLDVESATDRAVAGAIGVAASFIFLTGAYVGWVIGRKVLK